MNDPASLEPEDIGTCLQVLEAISERRDLLADLDPEVRRRLIVAAGRLSRPERAEQRQLAKAFRRRDRGERKAADEALLEATGIRTARRDPVFLTPRPVAPRLSEVLHLELPTESPEDVTAGMPAEAPPAASAEGLREARKCYVCKAEFRTVHFFYDAMCGPCGDLNHQKRNQATPLDGRVALVTGARVKIGYQAAIKLLRAGARVIVTTRFPHDAARRYAEETDYADWSKRLSIYGLDLRHTPSVELFARHLDATLDRLDFVLNNACQTVRRPPAYYEHLVAVEQEAVEALPERARPLVDAYEALRQRGALGGGSGRHAARRAAGLLEPAALSQVRTAADGPLAWALSSDTEAAPPEALFPRGRYDADQQQIDLRGVNSWRLTLGEVETVEMLEVQLVNAVAPFILNARLKPLMLRHRTFDKHIVNVSAMEGQFYRSFKTDRHPHTNMAKAALNMMTRTSAADYVKDGIHMNSVDTGWVTDEDPAVVAARKVEEHGFHPPLDIVDGAARICDPIFSGLLTGRHVWGQFLKDYAATDW
ncbi:SDR family NAD(P)-dependent oxidoreductase [Chondromyces apiculatus]|nr:SDR family oxidoreductase [Chondromyces apiculatus]